jgi:branched-chain amino acid transport system ATP-binding protein
MKGLLRPTSAGSGGGIQVLEARSINTYYGPMHILKDVSLTIGQGEIVALIGANGAGKTTTLRSIVGLNTPKSGEIHYKGERVDGLPTHEILKRGITLVPEGRRVFPNMSVLENLLMGGYLVKNMSLVKERLERNWTLFPRLLERQNQLAGTLSGGEQQMLSIARGLMSEPDLLLLDEPSLGLAPILVERVMGVIQEINDMGKTVLLVEQNAYLALELSTRTYVLETGRVALDGVSLELMENEHVRRAYLT